MHSERPRSSLTYAIAYGTPFLRHVGGRRATIGHRHGEEEALVLAQAPAGMERKDHRLPDRRAEEHGPPVDPVEQTREAAHQPLVEAQEPPKEGRPGGRGRGLLP